MVSLKPRKIEQMSLKKNLTLLINLKTHDTYNLSVFQPICYSLPQVKTIIKNKAFVGANHFLVAVARI